MAPSTAKSRSASLKTMKGALPPSSKLTFFSVLLANLASIFPTPVDPVNEIFLTIGLIASSVEASRSFVGHTCISFGGMPASIANFVKARHV